MVTAMAWVIGVRGSTCCKVFIVGAGGAVGLSGPWAKSEAGMVKSVRARTACFMTFLLLRSDPSTNRLRPDCPDKLAGKQGK
jgi:hypothetical protein